MISQKLSASPNAGQSATDTDKMKSKGTYSSVVLKRLRRSNARVVK